MPIWLWLIIGLGGLAFYVNLGCHFVSIYNDNRGKDYVGLTKLQKFMIGPYLAFRTIWDGIFLGIFWLIILFVIPLILWTAYYLFFGGISQFFQERKKVKED